MNADHIGIFVTLIGILASAIGGVGFYLFNQQNERIDKLEKTFENLKKECDIDIRAVKEQIIIEVKYNFQETFSALKGEIKEVKHSIKDIYNRFRERSDNARDKWANIVETVNSIIEYLKGYGYMSKNMPLKGLDKTLSNDPPTTNVLGDD